MTQSIKGHHILTSDHWKSEGDGWMVGGCYELCQYNLLCWLLVNELLLWPPGGSTKWPIIFRVQWSLLGFNKIFYVWTSPGGTRTVSCLPRDYSGYSPPDRVSPCHLDKSINISQDLMSLWLFPVCNVWLEAPGPPHLPVMQPDLTHRKAGLGIINDTANLSLIQTGDLKI